jgi:hypothetical protein
MRLRGKRRAGGTWRASMEVHHAIVLAEKAYSEGAAKGGGLGRKGRVEEEEGGHRAVALEGLGRGRNRRTGVKGGRVRGQGERVTAARGAGGGGSNSRPTEMAFRNGLSKGHIVGNPHAFL